VAPTQRSSPRSESPGFNMFDASIAPSGSACADECVQTRSMKENDLALRALNLFQALLSRRIFKLAAILRAGEH
jgi:hypothetical protein